MRTFLKLFTLVVIFTTISLSVVAQKSRYKCMIQMNGYNGEKAYVYISLINPNGQYQKTLFLLGNDKQWYKTLKEWYKFFLKTKKVDAKTGASVGGGDRALATFDIEDSFVNKGYKIRFESAVEDQKYNVTDVEVPLTDELLTTKSEGTGYIKYVRFSKVQP
jgi:hypothetical protein